MQILRDGRSSVTYHNLRTEKEAHELGWHISNSRLCCSPEVDKSGIPKWMDVAKCTVKLSQEIIMAKV